MDDDTILVGDDFLADFEDSTRRIPNTVSRRQARHSTSHVDFHVDPDTERIPAYVNSRRKQRPKPQHCPSCHCQPIRENHTVDKIRKNENFRRNNSDEPEATLSQHLEFATSTIANVPMKNCRVNSSHQQRNQNHRPGTCPSHCQKRNNPVNSGVHRHSQKYENLSQRHHRSRTRHDSSPREIVNSTIATLETDYRPPYEQMHSRNMCKDSRWHSPPGEPHSETDSPTVNRRNDHLDSTKRHSGQGESIDENCCDDDGRPSLETGSSVVKDDWQQYKRDQLELKDLGEDLRNFARQKMSAGEIVDEKKQRDDKARETYDKINLLVSKLPVPRRECSTTKRTSENQDKRCQSPKERTRIRTSRIDGRKTYHSARIDGRTGEERNHQELRRSLENDFLDIQFESSKLDYEENEDENDGKEEDDAASETEQEANELVNEKSDAKRWRRELTESWSEWKRSKTGNSRGTMKLKHEKMPEKLNFRKRDKISRDMTKGGRKKSVMSCENMKIPVNIAKNNCYDTRDNEFIDAMKSREKIDFMKNMSNTSEDNRDRDETREKMYERANSILDFTRKNCTGSSAAAACGTGDIELEKSKTRTCIDEMIDSGLSREAKRENCTTLPAMKKDFPHEADVTDGVSVKRTENSDELSKIIGDEYFCRTSTESREIFPTEERTANELVAVNKRDDCFCQRIVKILADHTSPRDYVRKLKNLRWSYLNNIQSDLGKLYDVETFLDSCSSLKNVSIVKSGQGPDSTRKAKKNSDKRAKERCAGEL